MAKRYFNWKLAIVLVISVVVLSLTAFGLRQWQRTNRADRSLVLGNKAYDEQNWREAAENLGRYLTIEQNDITVLMKYAEANLKIRPLRRSNIAQAINAYRIVLRADKNNSEAAIQLAELYLSRYLPGEAELIVSKYLENNDHPDPKLRRMLARAFADQRKFTEAAEQLKRLIQEHPDQILAYELLGQLTEERPDDFPDLPQGEHWFNEAVKKNPSSALAYTIRAGFYRDKDFSKALADLGQAEKMDLTDTDVELRLAREYINAELLDKAEKHLKAVKSASPVNLDMWGLWADLAIKSKSSEKMLEVAENSLKELSSQAWDFMPTATELFIRCDRLDRAAECISQMNEIDVAPVKVAYLEGLLAAEKGHLFEAVKHWRESMELGNNSVQIRLMLSSVLSRAGDTQSALRYLRTVVSEHPGYIGGHLALASLLAKSGNWDQSFKHAAAANQIAPENPEAALIYLEARMRLPQTGSTGDIAQMLQDLEKAAGSLPEFKMLKFRYALQRKNFTDAQALVNQMKKDYPSQIDTIMSEVELFVAQDKTDDAISILLKVLKEFPQEVEPVRYLAILFARQGDKEKCEAVIKEALERIDRPVNRRILGLLLAEYYNRWNQKDNVYPLLDTLVKELPEDIPLKRGLLLCEQIINDPERAQKIVNDIKSLEGEEGWQWRYEQARVWFSSEDFEANYTQIVSLLQENIQNNPNDQESRMLLAAAYENSDQLQLAISTYREALSRSPEDLRVIIPTINALSKAMEFDEVDQLLNRASQANLFHPQLQRFQLQSYLRHEQLNSALDILQDLIKNDPDNQANRFSLALIYIKQDKFDEAKKLLDELKNQAPNSLKIADAQVRLYIRQNKMKEALKLCDEMVNNLHNASAYIFRARTYASINQTDKAMEDLENAASIEPGNVEVWMIKSRFYRSLGRLDKAIDDIQKAMSLDSGNILIQKQAVSLFLDSGDTDMVLQGKTILDKALEMNPDDVDLRLFKVASLLNEGTDPEIEEAEKILRRITDDHPEVGRAWELLGRISFQRGQAEKALEIAFRGLSHTPNNEALLLLKANAEAVRSPVLAVPTIKALLEMDPNNTDAALLLAWVHISSSEPEKAVDILESLLASCVGTPEERRIKTYLAVALYNCSNSKVARQKFNSILQSEKDSLILVDIARHLKSINDIWAQKTAEDILRRVIQKDSDSIEAITSLAVLLQTSGRSDEAMPLYRRVLELQPDNPVVMNNLAWLMCEDKGMLKEALQLAQKGLKLFPNYVDLIDTRGSIYYHMGEFDMAIEDFTACIKLYPEGTASVVGSYFRLAKTFIKLGQNDKALENLNQALQLQSRIGGLTTSELTEAQTLLTQLQEGK
jgi:tetratricopeptide (TPR) repeat protein